MKRENYAIVVYQIDETEMRDKHVVFEELFYSSVGLEVMRTELYAILDDMERVK